MLLSRRSIDTKATLCGVKCEFTMHYVACKDLKDKMKVFKMKNYDYF